MALATVWPRRAPPDKRERIDALIDQYERLRIGCTGWLLGDQRFTLLESWRNCPGSVKESQVRSMPEPLRDHDGTLAQQYAAGELVDIGIGPPFVKELVGQLKLLVGRTDKL